MKKTKKALASLAIAGMVLSMAPMSVFAADSAASNRIFGADRVQTAVEVAKQGWTTATTAIVAPAEDEHLVDALAAAPLAGAKNAPILLVEGKTLTTATTDELKALGVKDVYVVGAVDADVVTSLTAAGYNATAVKGASRMDTAAEIAKLLSAPKGSFVVGYDAIPDALSVASYAAANNYQILVANVDGTLPANEVVAGTSYVLGGPTLVKDIAGAKRVFGNDRYDTNKAVLSELSYSYDKVYVANGEDSHLVDSLVASGLAGKTMSPIALTDNMAVKAAADLSGKMGSASQTIALGGTSVVADSVRDSVKYVAPATLAVESVSAINAKEIVVSFNKEVDEGSAVNTANYTVKVGGAAAAVSSIEVDEDDATKVTITLTNPIQAITSVDVKVKKDIMAADFTKPEADYSTAFVFYDKVAPSIASAVVDGNELTVNFNEYIASAPLMKVNGKVVTAVAGTVWPAKELKIDLTSLDLADGSYVFSAANVNDLQTTPNIASYLTATVYVSDAAAAPAVKAITTKTATTFQVEFTKGLKAGTVPTVSAKKGSAEMVPAGGVVAVAGSTTKFIVTVADVAGVVDLYETGETSVPLTVTVSDYQAASNNLYGNKITQSVTLSKDSVGPVLLTGYNKLLADGVTIQVRFNEEVQNADASNITVVDKNGVKLTVTSATPAADVDGDNTYLNILMSAAIGDGVQTVTFNKGAVEDLSGNDNAAASTTVSKSSSSASIASAVANAASNVITITYAEKMTSAAINLANYTLDNAAMPAGSVIYFNDLGQTTVKIELPSASISDASARVLMISANVVADSGNTLTSAQKTQVIAAGFVDNVKPVLVSATKDTTTTIKVKFSEDMQAAIVDPAAAELLNDFKVKVNGSVVAVSAVNLTADADTLVLTVPVYNKTQTVTVETVKDSLTLTDASTLNIVKGETVVTAN